MKPIIARAVGPTVSGDSPVFDFIADCYVGVYAYQLKITASRPLHCVTCCVLTLTFILFMS